MNSKNILQYLSFAVLLVDLYFSIGYVNGTTLTEPQSQAVLASIRPKEADNTVKRSKSRTVWGKKRRNETKSENPMAENPISENTKSENPISENYKSDKPKPKKPMAPNVFDSIKQWEAKKISETAKEREQYDVTAEDEFARRHEFNDKNLRRTSRHAPSAVQQLTEDDLLDMVGDDPIMKLTVLENDNGVNRKVNNGNNVLVAKALGVRDGELGLGRIEKAIFCNCKIGWGSEPSCLSLKAVHFLKQQEHELSWIIPNLVLYDISSRKLYWVYGPVIRVPHDYAFLETIRGGTISVDGVEKEIRLPVAPIHNNKNVPAKVTLPIASKYWKDNLLYPMGSDMNRISDMSNKVKTYLDKKATCGP